MNGMLVAEPTVFLVLDTARVQTLVFRRIVVPTFALGAFKGNFISHFLFSTPTCN
jgi:hypothetical protein